MTKEKKADPRVRHDQLVRLGGYLVEKKPF